MNKPTLNRGPTDARYINIWDRLFPRHHHSYWATVATELKESFTHGKEEDAKAAFEHVKAVADTATERAEAADRRATTIAGTVAIAASFTLGGAGVVLDGQKFAGHGNLRTAFGAVLALTTIAFVTSAVYALTALVKARSWQWPDPNDLKDAKEKCGPQRYNTRSVRLLADFGFNWEISVQKNHLVDKALWSLVSALVGIAALAVIVFLTVA